jgi:tRNA-splicing ligase RtcB
MSRLRLTGKQLRAIGYPEGPVISIAMNIMEKNFKHHTQEEALDVLKNIISSSCRILPMTSIRMIAKQLLPKVSPPGEI